MSCAVLDASAILHARDARAFQGMALYTTDLVLEELRDPRARAAVEILGINVVPHEPRKLKGGAHTLRGLSPADISVLLLAAEYGCTLFTDDGKLYAAARRMGVHAKRIYYGGAGTR